MKVKNWKVYVHINKINKKRYYGITKQKINKRWQNGNGYSHNEHFTRAIQKYGWDNFEHIVIARGLTEEEAKWLEMELIREHDTMDESKGYNQTLGGNGTLGWKPTDEWKRKQSEKNSGEGNPMFGKHHTEETIKKISKAKSNPSSETRKKMSENHADVSGKNNPRATIYKVIDNNGEFIGYFCGNELYDKDNSNGMLGISKGVFNKHIKPFGNIDISRILTMNKTSNQHVKNMIEKLRPFNNWIIVKA